MPPSSWPGHRRVHGLARLVPCVLGLALGIVPLQATPIPTPNGRTLTPAGTLVTAGDFPAAALLSPSGTLFVADAGESTNTLLAYNTQTMASVSLPATLPPTFNGVVASGALAQSGGLAFSPDGTTLYVGGGGGGVLNPTRGAASVVRAYTATPTPVLTTTYTVTGRYVGGVAVGQSGRYLYVTEPFSNTIDPTYGKGTQLVRVDTQNGGAQTNATVGRHPLAVVDGVLPSTGEEVVVTANRDDATLSVVDAATLAAVRTVPVGRHPAAMAFTDGGAHLLVLNSLDDTLYDITTADWRVAKKVSFNTRYGLGAAPSAMAVSPDGHWVYVALSGDNAVGVVYRSPQGAETLLGRIPTAAYPTSVSLDQAHQTLLVTAGKGVEGPSPSNLPLPFGEANPGPLGGVPIPTAPVPNMGPAAVGVNGTLEVIPVPANPTQLAAYSYQVAADNNWVHPATSHLPAALTHVVYLIRENKTYDEEFGDEPGGLPAYLMYGRGVTPNTHALAEGYALLESFYADEELSDTGHQVVMGGQANDWVQRISQQAYGIDGAPRQGAELGDGDDVLWAPANYLLDNALAHNLTFRDYGEFYRQDQSQNGPAVTPALDAHIVHNFPGFGFAPDTPDTQRVAFWLKDFNSDVTNGTFPALEVIYLPEDHTSAPATAQQYVGDSDLATGQIIQALSHSPYWGNTAVFLTEDDPQSGLDHIDDHRTIGLVVSPYVIPNGPVTTRYDQAGMLRTIEEILGLPALTEFDATALPMDALFGGTPNLTPYNTVAPTIPAMSAQTRAGVTRLARRLLGPHPRLDRIPPRVQLQLQWYATHGTPTLPAKPKS